MLLIAGILFVLLRNNVCATPCHREEQFVKVEGTKYTAIYRRQLQKEYFRVDI